MSAKAKSARSSVRWATLVAMRDSCSLVLVVAFAGFAVAACGDDAGQLPSDAGEPLLADAAATRDAAFDADLRCRPGSDDDGDGIANGLEGCEAMPPPDTDSDGLADYLDADSDGDGVDDGYEDRNGDGLLGDCTGPCTSSADCMPGSHCAVRADGGVCVEWACLAGETDPRATDTDGDGVGDVAEGTRVCDPASDANPGGLKEVKVVDSSAAILDASPNWRIALELAAVEGTVTIALPDPAASAYLFDLTGAGEEVAGFLITRPALPGEASAARAAQNVIERLRPGALPGATQAVLRVSGTRTTSLDGFDTVLGTTVVLTHPPADAIALRRKVVESLSGRSPADLTFPAPAATFGAGNQFAVLVQTLVRPDRSQVVVMGAVARLVDLEDATRRTGFLAADLSHGTGLTVSLNGETTGCEPFLVSRTPKADFIWVLDESGSMADDRANVATNATEFFERALAAGLDFRLGVTDMDRGRSGLFATREPGSTGDRWLAPAELARFQADVNDPSGPDLGSDEYGPTQAMNAVARHTPRSASDDRMVRPDAELVVLFVSDEKPQELEDADIFVDGDVPATPAQLSASLTELKDPIDLLQAERASVHAISVPAPYPSCSDGGGETGWGYIDMVSWFGGQLGSICQPDLSPTLQTIIDNVLGAASPVVLEWVPISASLAVALDGAPLPRSREAGWDYDARANSIVFHGVPIDPTRPRDLVVSYRRWIDQSPIE